VILFWDHIYLGPIPKANHPLSLLNKDARDKILLKGDVKHDQTPLKGQVHYLLTPWLEIILHLHPT
jgi:hypothetical protein